MGRVLRNCSRGDKRPFKVDSGVVESLPDGRLDGRCLRHLRIVDRDGKIDTAGVRCVLNAIDGLPERERVVLEWSNAKVVFPVAHLRRILSTGSLP